MARVYGNNPNHWRAYCDYGVSSTDTATTVTISAAGLQSVGWGFQLSSGVSVTASCTGQAAKSGSGGFASATGATVEKSFVSGSWAVARTTSAQTLTVTVTVANSSGYMDGTSTLSFQVTVPALPSYAVSYNANGGSGAPASQTKWHGTALALSSTRPTRAGYIFQGWATSASGAVAYQPGASYAGNAALALYAVWRLAYVAPTISSCSAQRCGSSGTAQDGGTYAKVTAKWAVSTAYSSANKASSVKVEYRKKGASAWTSGATQTPNAASGTLSAVVGAGSLTADDQWEFRVTVADSGGSSAAQCSVAGQHYPMDVGNKGRTVAFGRAASSTAGLEVGMEARFDSNVRCNALTVRRSSLPSVGSTPSSAVYGGYEVQNADGVVLGDAYASVQADGRVGMQLESVRAVGSSKVYHNVRLLVDSSGKRSVTMSDPAAWRSAIGATAVSDQSGWKVLRRNDGSGLVEIMCRLSLGSCAMTNAFGALFYRDWNTNFPFTFKSVCNAQLTLEAGSGLYFSNIHYLDGSKVSYRLVSATSTTQAVFVHIRVAGTV